MEESSKGVLNPEKELRFSRYNQAVLFLMIACVFFAVSLVFFIVRVGPDGGLSSWAAVCIPLPFCIALVCFAYRCLKHPYLILSPVGIEVFPFWKPVKGFQIITWGEIQLVEFDEVEKVLTLHFTKEKTAGIVLSLSPIQRKQRELLKTALEGVMKNRKLVNQ